METKNKSELYALQNKVNYLEKIISELENEIYKLRCGIKVVKKNINPKKLELISALRDLKQKTNKTQKDKDNIYLIEVILKNMK